MLFIGSVVPEFIIIIDRIVQENNL